VADLHRGNPSKHFQNTMQSKSKGLRRGISLAVILVAGVAMPAATYGQGQANPVFDDLVKNGVPFNGGFRKIRPPTLPDGLNAQQQQQEVQAVLNKKPGMPVTFKQFTENNLNAKYVLLIDDLTPPFGGPGQPGHSIDLWFVVWGQLPTLTAPAFLKQQFQPDPNDKMDVLQPNDLPANIVPQKVANGGEWWVHGQFMLLSNDQRAQVRATARAFETTNQDSGTVGAIIDKSFNQHPKFPNEWRPVTGKAGGQPQLGQPTPYVSAGGYVKITKLLQPAGALLVEYHMVYDEPNGWFDGKNLLRPKLNTKTEDDVRNFRRKVKNAAQAAPKG
jgi:hypothetical protein